MIRWLIRRQLDAFERALHYDVTYMRDILDADVAAMRAFHAATRLREYRGGVPADPWHAATLVAMQARDCGPCLQLSVQLAQADGLSRDRIRDILHDEPIALPADTRLAMAFARSVLDRDPLADDVHDEVQARWGRRGRIGLAFAVLVTDLYPGMKYALGHARSCGEVHVDGEAVWSPANRPVQAPA